MNRALFLLLTLTLPVCLPGAIPPSSSASGPVVVVFTPAALERAWEEAFHDDDQRRARALRELRRLSGMPDADPEWLLKRALPEIGSLPTRKRSAALEILVGLGSRAASAKPKLFAAIPGEKDLNGISAIDALLAIGVTESDRPTITEILKRELPEETRRYLSASLAGDEEPLPQVTRELLNHLRARERDPMALWNHADARVREEAVDALAGVEGEPVAKARALIGMLRDPARNVRAAASRQLSGLPPEAWLNRAVLLLGERKPGTRAGVCALLEMAAPVLTSQKPAVRQALAEVMHRYPVERESWAHSPESAWRALGVTAADVPALGKLLRDHTLQPARRAQVIRLIAAIDPRSAASVLLEPLSEVLKTDPRRIPVAQQWARTGVDGDLTAALDALVLLSAEAEPGVARRLRERLKIWGELQDMSLPERLREKAKLALSRLPHTAST